MGLSMRTCFFTSISSNYLEKALALAESTLIIYNKADFYIAILNFRFLSKNDHKHLQNLQDYFLDNIGFLKFIDPLMFYEYPDSFLYRYNIIEACTAVKPAIALALFERNDCVTYFDPDIILYAPLPPDPNISEDNWYFQVTPHIIEPPKVTGLISERLFLNYGVYNLGYFSVKKNIQTISFLKWWKQFCYDFGIDKPTFGLFVDQKPIDLITCFIDHVSIIKDPGWNVAWWNLYSDKRSIDDQGYKVILNGIYHDLIFFHFSNLQKPLKNRRLVISAPLSKLMPKDSRDIYIDSHKGLSFLFSDYNNRIQRWSEYTLILELSHKTNKLGCRIPTYTRLFYGEALRLGMTSIRNPYDHSTITILIYSLRYIISRVHRTDIFNILRSLLSSLKSILYPSLMRYYN